MNLKQLGEFGLIDRLTKGIRTDKSVIVGVGDDAAVLAFNKKEYLLLTCDMLIEDVDFIMDYAKPQQIGWKAASCSVSDVAAMGGVPKWMVMSVGIPKRLGLKTIDGIYSGVKKAAEKFGINIVGGDISHSEKLAIDVTMLGVVRKKNLVKRSGAKIGDAIFVTGTLGGAVKSRRHLDFIPRIKEAQVLVKNFTVNSMIDISDSLSSDLNHILRMSRAGAVIKEKLLPLSKGATVTDALTEGEDFELLFTVPKKDAGRLEEKFARLMRITRIGEITRHSEGFKLIEESGMVRQIKPKGYDHFA